MEGICCLLIDVVGVRTWGTTRLVPSPIVVALQVVSTDDSFIDETLVEAEARFEDATLCD